MYFQQLELVHEAEENSLLPSAGCMGIINKCLDFYCVQYQGLFTQGMVILPLACSLVEYRILQVVKNP